MAPRPPEGHTFDWILAKPEVLYEVSSGVRRHPALTSTAFWRGLWAEFPDHSRKLREIVATRTRSGLIKSGTEFRWIIGTGGLYVEHDEWGAAGHIDGLVYTLDFNLPRGTFLLVRVERACP